MDFVLNHRLWSRKQFNFRVQTSQSFWFRNFTQVSESVFSSSCLTVRTFFDPEIACSGITRSMLESNFSPTKRFSAENFELRFYIFCWKRFVFKHRLLLNLKPSFVLCMNKNLCLSLRNVNFTAKPCGLSWHSNNDTLFTSFMQLKRFQRLQTKPRNMAPQTEILSKINIYSKRLYSYALKNCTYLHCKRVELNIMSLRCNKKESLSPA